MYMKAVYGIKYKTTKHKVYIQNTKNKINAWSQQKWSIKPGQQHQRHRASHCPQVLPCEGLLPLPVPGLLTSLQTSSLSPFP